MQLGVKIKLSDVLVLFFYYLDIQITLKHRICTNNNDHKYALSW